jgi:hypothetical protein
MGLEVEARQRRRELGGLGRLDDANACGHTANLANTASLLPNVALISNGARADTETVAPQFSFPWRLLGELLVAKGVISATELDSALREQRATGRRLGEVLVSRGALDAQTLTSVLAEQYGIDLPPSTSFVPSGEAPAPWQPLGRLLVARGVISQPALDEALASQRSTGRRLGDILVTDHGVSMLDLAAALGEQHGLAIHSEAPPRRPSRFTDDWLYEISEPTEAPLFRTDSFLEATDFAFEYLAAESPARLEIVRLRGTSRERVWEYDREASSAVDDLVDVYGFDPNAWRGPPGYYSG